MLPDNWRYDYINLEEYVFDNINTILKERVMAEEIILQENNPEDYEILLAEEILLGLLDPHDIIENQERFIELWNLVTVVLCLKSLEEKGLVTIDKDHNVTLTKKDI